MTHIWGIGWSIRNNLWALRAGCAGRVDTTQPAEQGRWMMASLRMTTAVVLLVLFGLDSNTAHASPLTSAFEAACALNPEVETLTARRAEVDARKGAADALLPGGPWATVTHRTDALTRNRDTREYDAEFTVPVWLRGERSAALAAALTGAERLEAEISSRRLDVARRVRDAYWMVAEAREKLAIAERRRSTASNLAQTIQAQTRSAQAELVDTRMATADVRDAEAALAGRKSELDQARIAFRVLSGRDPPAAFTEQTSVQATPDNHPRLLLRRKAIEKAEADRSLVYAADRERPEFGVFATNSRDTSAEPNVTSLGVRVKIPFAYDAVNAPKRAAASAEVVGAQSELAQAEREVSGEAAQARARLEGARQQFAALDARYADLATVVELSQKSQQAGQTPLTDLIRARLQLYDAATARVVARIAVEKARSDYIQALGLEP